MLPVWLVLPGMAIAGVGGLVGAATERLARGG
jgi:hypothetical protein